MNYNNNYGKIYQDSKIKKTNDDDFFKIIKKERQKQKTIFAGNDIDYSKTKRYEREKINPSHDTMNVQKTLNEYGFTDSEGKKLKVDGVYGPKTDSAFTKAYNANKSILENHEKLQKQKEIKDVVNRAYDRLLRNAEKRNIDMPKSDIVKTKKFLNQNGYTDIRDNPLEENDIWDNNTKIAFEKYVLDGIPRREILELQKILNKNGITDKDGNSLLEDGKLGKKTDSAVHNAVKSLGGNLDTEIKRGDSKKNARIKKDISGKGINKQWSVGDKSVVPGKPSGMNIYHPIAETLLLDIRDGKNVTSPEKYLNVINNDPFAGNVLNNSKYNGRNISFSQPIDDIINEAVEYQQTKDMFNSLETKAQENITKYLGIMGYDTNENDVYSAIVDYAKKNNIDYATAIKRIEKINTEKEAEPKSIYVGVRGIAETYGDIFWDDTTNTANVELYDGSKFNFKQKDGKGTFIGSDGKMYVSVLPNNNGVGYNLPSLSGDPSVDLMLYKALGERGYKEGYNNDNKYGKWFKNPNTYWCAQFVSWAADGADIIGSVVDKYQSCAVGRDFYKAKNAFHYVTNGDKPKAGDTFFMSSTKYPNGGAHTGLILAYTIENGEEIVYTIEGNAQDAVCVGRRRLSDLYGFGSNGGTTNGIVPKNYDFNEGSKTT